MEISYGLCLCEYVCFILTIALYVGFCLLFCLLLKVFFATVSVSLSGTKLAGYKYIDFDI